MKSVTQDEIRSVIKIVERILLMRYAEKGFHKAASKHEVLGIITEEYHELIEAIHSNSKHDIAHELIDGAVSHLHGLISLYGNKIVV
jgi:hypothetical protein